MSRARETDRKQNNIAGEQRHSENCLQEKAALENISGFLVNTLVKHQNDRMRRNRNGIGMTV